MTQARYALLSVTDKTNIVPFAKGLIERGLKILSTGGTASLLREHGCVVTDVAEFTGHPECLDGRVKTLHPKVHGGLLADRSNKDHLKDMQRLGFESIDVVAVNLYDFAGQAAGKNISLAKTIEFIDIGGPTMLRAAAKNHASVYVVADPKDYDLVLDELAKPSASSSLRAKLALKVFALTASYDAAIAADLAQKISEGTTDVPATLSLQLSALQHLRYGENAHQQAAVYTLNGQKTGLTNIEIKQGKELSYNNYVDLDAAAAIVADLDPLPAVTIIKHTNPCGTACKPGANAKDLFSTALVSDPKCAFGGIVASNLAIDGPAAQLMADIFLECIIAPHYTAEALQIFAAKKNLRIVVSQATQKSGRSDHLQIRSITGGMLAQTLDQQPLHSKDWKVVSQRAPTDQAMDELQFAMTLCRHVKSNAIVLTKNGQSIGIGAGQMSRVDSARIAIEKAKELGHDLRGAVAASDAFFPFRDGVDTLAAAGITAIVHPGGSVRDQESVDAANEHGIALAVTGIRVFKH